MYLHFYKTHRISGKPGDMYRLPVTDDKFDIYDTLREAEDAVRANGGIVLKALKMEIKE